MKYFEFSIDKFNNYAILWAVNEASALRRYSKLYNYKGFLVPNVVDLDKLYQYVVVVGTNKNLRYLDYAQRLKYFYGMIDKCVNSKETLVVL